MSEENLDQGQQNSFMRQAYSKYFENIFELQKQMLDLEEKASLPDDINPFSQETLISNLTPQQEVFVAQLFDFIGDLQDLKLFGAIGPFRNMAFAVLNLSRSRDGFQQKTFTTQTLKQDISQKLSEKTGNNRFWGRGKD